MAATVARAVVGDRSTQPSPAKWRRQEESALHKSKHEMSVGWCVPGGHGAMSPVQHPGGGEGLGEEVVNA